MRIRQKLFQLVSFFNYWLRAVNEHSLHPPFIFNLYSNVVKPAQAQPEFKVIEDLRKELLNNQSLLTITDLGAGSSCSSAKQRKISEIARHSLTSPRFSQLLFRLIRHMDAQVILELGTCLGINTLYFSAAAPAGKVYSIEGCPETAKVAKSQFQKWPLANISLTEGNIDRTLPALLKGIKKIDAVYLDANHTYEASIRYFGLLLPCLHARSFVVVDDIYWSPGMKKAWLKLQQHDKVSMSLDLYDAGILFFQPGLQKEHYVLAL